MESANYNQHDISESMLELHHHHQKLHHNDDIIVKQPDGLLKLLNGTKGLVHSFAFPLSSIPDHHGGDDDNHDLLLVPDHRGDDENLHYDGSRL